MTHPRALVVVLALALGAGPVQARVRQPEPQPNNPPVPRVRLHYIPRAVPRVRTHLLPRPVEPEVWTRWLVPPVQPKPIYRELAPPGSRNERELQIVRQPHYREGLEAAKEPDRDRADVEVHRLTRWANDGQAPRIKLKPADQGRLREAVQKQVYAEMRISRFSSPGDRSRADALVPARYQRALRNGDALELLSPNR